MIWALLLAHVVVVSGLSIAGDRLGRHVFAVAALPPALTALWALARLGDEPPMTASVEWVEGLDLELAFSVGPLATLLTVIVSGIGLLVFIYSAGYFAEGATGTGRFAATLLAFSAAMVGLVWSDSIWTLFLFWELTSITSFLLVGHKDVDPVARAAARRALLITVAGGLALLAGFVIVADEAGSARLSEMGPVDGAAATVAALLVMVGAATKSAQVPFHVWLPGAMAAPTPVSAYLHSATMVKAGVVLVAVAAPVFTEVGAWGPTGVGLGLATMIWGAIGALRHLDAKLILAWGTVSQLGLMVALLSIGTGKATFAAVSVLTAHAVFKAALFMVVGEIDVRTKSRRIDELSGLWRTMPVPFAVAVVSGASMAGVPPLLGFPAKEAAVEAALGLEGVEAVVVLFGVIVGSVLTVAYTVRLLLGLFATKPELAPTAVASVRVGLAAPVATLGVISVAGFVFLGSITGAVRPAAVDVDPAASVYALLRWPGLTTALYLSSAIVLVGAALGTAVAGRRVPVPAAIGADAVDGIIDGVLDVARWIAGRVQHGSLPVYLVTMAGTAAVATLPFALAIDVDVIRAWDNGAQAVLAVLVVAAAGASTTVRSRIGAALGLGVVGLGVAGLFVAHGAPDLVLTQLLVETVVVVGFVVGLGHLTRRFPPAGVIWRGVRVVVSALIGTAVTVALLASASGSAGEPPITTLVDEAKTVGGGNNVVNVILTDIRALDTLGEILVLAVVAVGIVALAAPAALRPDASEGAS
ncbi:MAG: DUF4040 domain-containing protein [Acidimicrobiia bacterium]|nr:DUF4040 domain-containing protein [Acidimicrobiia bacterium]